MRIGTTTNSLMLKYPDEREALPHFAELGISCLDYSGFNYNTPDCIYMQPGWEDYALELREIADKNGITFSQVHAPMISFRDPEEVVETKMEITRRMFRLGEILGAPYLVIHPRMFPDGINGENREKYLSLNVELYKTLLPLAEKHKVAIALENMFGFDPRVNRICRTTFSTMEEMMECEDRLNSDWVAICLDTGHVNLLGESPALAAKKLGSRLKLLHVHDNYGISDDHLVCGYGIIDWDAFLEVLKDIGYQGEFSSEAGNTALQLPAEVSDLGVKVIAEVSRALLARHGIPAE